MALAAIVRAHEDDARQGSRESAWQTKEHMLRSKVLPFLDDMRICDSSNASAIGWHDAVANIALAQDRIRNDSILMGTWSTRAVQECSTQKTRKGLEKRSSA